MAKPVVDGLQRELGGKVRFIKVDVGEDAGAEVATRFHTSGVPTFILLDGQGRIVYRQTGGRPNADEIRSKASALQ